MARLDHVLGCVTCEAVKRALADGGKNRTVTETTTTQERWIRNTLFFSSIIIRSRDVGGLTVRLSLFGFEADAGSEAKILD